MPFVLIEGIAETQKFRTSNFFGCPLHKNPCSWADLLLVLKLQKQLGPYKCMGPKLYIYAILPGTG